MKEVENVKITIEAEAKEIAALVVALQERQKTISISPCVRIPNRNANDVVGEYHELREADILAMLNNSDGI